MAPLKLWSQYGANEGENASSYTQKYNSSASNALAILEWDAKMGLSELSVWLFDKVVISVFVGIASSAIFFLVLSRFKPKVSISSKIAKGNAIANGEIIYRIKVINKTSYPITDIKAQLHLLTPYELEGGDIWISKSVKLVRSDPIVIEKFNKRDTDANYAYRFVTYENLDEMLSTGKSQYLMFSVSCKHSLSGFGGVFSMPYRISGDCIENGDFAKGDSFSIVAK